MRMRVVGEEALLAEYPNLDAALAAYAAASATMPRGVVELVPAARTILVTFAPALITRAAVTTWFQQLRGRAITRAGDLVRIPVVYDGEDLADVAEMLGIDTDEVIRRHTGAEYRVAFTGFAPGFGYLTGGHPSFDVPRRPSPRTRIPAGSVALAGAFSGVYPTDSPGGWQLIGRTPQRMWDADRSPAALLSPGTRVRFDAIDRAEFEQRDTRAAGAPRTPVQAAVGIEIVRPALQTLVQDLGRPGLAALGVAASGAADHGSHRDANALVGNEPNAATLELAGGGACLRMHGDHVLALAGAHVTAVIVTREGDEMLAQVGAPFLARDGAELEISAASRGMRAYVAVRGGIDVASVLGSRSTDTLARLGPAPLGAGVVLPVAPRGGEGRAVGEPMPPRCLPASGDLVVLDVVLGPRDDWFEPESVRALQEQEWQVTPRSDRVGVRLAGRPLERCVPAELPSEGTVRGAIQVPADGQPVLFLADRPLTGGYPVIAVVTQAHLDLAAQLPAGARVQFRVVPSACG